MLQFPAAVDIPLRRDENGAIRIGDTRVLLEVVIGAHQRGDTPEQIVERYDGLTLEAVYAVIAYYLSHRAEVDAYIAEAEAQGAAIREAFEALPGYAPLTREMLAARMKGKKRRQE